MSGEVYLKPLRKSCFAETYRKHRVVAHLRDLTMMARIHIYSLGELAAASDKVENNFWTPGRLPLVAPGLRLLQEAFAPALFHRGLLAFDQMKG